MSKKSKAQFHTGKMMEIIFSAVKAIKENSFLLEDPERLYTMVMNHYGKEDCLNCGRSMQINVYTAGIVHALLLLEMAKQVREELRKGVEFTKANRIHIDRLPIATSIKKQQSQLGYLGLIHPVISSARSGYWLITSWGWKALRGEPIPKWVKYWNRQLIERSEEMTTLSEMMRTHRQKIDDQIRLGKAVKQMDHRSEIDQYNPIEWVEYSGIVEPEKEIQNV